MPLLLRVFSLWIVLLATTVSLLAQEGTDETYAQIPVLGESGEKKLQAGDTNGAIEDFKRAFEFSRELKRRYPQEPAYAENAYFYLGRLSNAFGVAGAIPQALQMAEPSARGYQELFKADPNEDNKLKATDGLNRLAWYQILSGDGANAETNIRAGLALTPDESMLKVNLAHALLLNGKQKEAEALYLAERTNVRSDGKKVRDIILKDFEEIEAAGVANAGFAKMRKALGGAKSGTSRGQTTGRKSNIPVWPLVVLVFLGIGAIFAFLIYLDRKRTAKVEAAVKALGLTFRRKSSEEDKQLTAGAAIATVGRSRGLTNIIEVPETDGARVTLFDFSYVVGYGKSSRTYQQTVTRIQSSRLNLPSFDLRPEGILAKIVQSLGGKDIDFADWPNFSKMFILRGQDETTIRHLFSAPLLQYCEQNKGTWISGSGNLLWFHRENRRLKPEDVEAFVLNARQIFALFLAVQGGADTPIAPPPLPPLPPPPLPPA